MNKGTATIIDAQLHRHTIMTVAATASPCKPSIAKKKTGYTTDDLVLTAKKSQSDHVAIHPASTKIGK
jgi:hypothetical protein